MDKLIKVVAVQDDSGHWYVIPSEKLYMFNELMESAREEDEFESFDLEFSKYMTGGDLNLIQLYAEI